MIALGNTSQNYVCLSSGKTSLMNTSRFEFDKSLLQQKTRGDAYQCVVSFVVVCWFLILQLFSAAQMQGLLLQLRLRLYAILEDSDTGSFGGASHAYVDKNMQLDPTKHRFHKAPHPHAWIGFGLKTTQQVEQLTRTVLALLSRCAGRMIDYDQPFPNFLTASVRLILCACL